MNPRFAYKADFIKQKMESARTPPIFKIDLILKPSKTKPL